MRERLYTLNDFRIRGQSSRSDSCKLSLKSTSYYYLAIMKVTQGDSIPLFLFHLSRLPQSSKTVTDCTNGCGRPVVTTMYRHKERAIASDVAEWIREGRVMPCIWQQHALTVVCTAIFQALVLPIFVGCNNGLQPSGYICFSPRYRSAQEGFSWVHGKKRLPKLSRQMVP